jgi:hypothetical protein
MNNLAQTYLALGRLADALPLSEEAFRQAKAKLGPGHPDTLKFIRLCQKTGLHRE